MVLSTLNPNLNKRRVKAVPKAKISVSLDVEVVLWVDKQVRKGVFESRSQGIEQMVKQKMKGAK